MLFADKEALETDLKVSLLAIRERELNLYVQNCRSISTQTSVLAGFAYGGCCLGSYLFPEDVSEGMQASYLVATIWAMALNVFCIFSATLCTMLGPGLALRGPDGSMEQAVEGLAIEYRFTFVVYFMGLMMFFLAAILFVFLMFDPFLATLLCVLIIIFVVNMLRACKRIYKRFRLPMHQAVAGNFNPDGTLGASINESQSSDARRLEQMRRDKKWHEWHRRQYLYLRVFLEEFLGISSTVYEQRYADMASKGERWYNMSITNILRQLEYKAHKEMRSPAGSHDGPAYAHGLHAGATAPARASPHASPARQPRPARRNPAPGRFMRGRARAAHAEESLSLHASHNANLELTAMEPSQHLVSGAISPPESTSDPGDYHHVQRA